MPGWAPGCRCANSHVGWPTAGVLFRKMSGAGLGEHELRRLLTQAEKMIRARDENAGK